MRPCFARLFFQARGLLKQLNLTSATRDLALVPGKTRDLSQTAVPNRAALARIQYQRKLVQNSSCGTADANLFPWLNTTLSADKKNEEAKLNLKSREEIEQYLSCDGGELPGPEKDAYCHFRTTLSPLIELAATSAHLPYAVQACLFKKESQFSAHAESKSAHAKGYIQFMDGTVKDMQVELKTQASDWLKIMQEEKSSMAKFKAAGKQADYNETRAMYVAHYAHYRARLVWDQYWEGTANPPRTIDAKGVACQNTAFIAAAVKQTLDYFLFAKPDPDSIQDDEMPNLGSLDARESAVYLAGAYNLGKQKFGQICRNFLDVQKCIRKMPVLETRNHLIAVEACSRKDDWRSTDASTRPPNRELVGCEDKKCVY